MELHYKRLCLWLRSSVFRAGLPDLHGNQGSVLSLLGCVCQVSDMQSVMTSDITIIESGEPNTTRGQGVR